MTDEIATNNGQAVDKPEPKPLRVGYVVGINEQDEIVFEFIGSNPAIIEVLGLHKVADERIRMEMESNIGTGYPAIANSLSKMSTILVQLLNAIKKGAIKHE